MTRPGRRSTGPEILGALDCVVVRRSGAVVGVDEVGRGSLAGPVVICAACFDDIPAHPGVRDSKRLTPKRRREMAAWIRTVCSDWVIVEVWQEMIDTVNILEATRLAMRSGVRALRATGFEVVVDYVDLGDLGMPVHSIKRADAQYFSVAAASILAKVHRDGIMTRLASESDPWEWSQNMGYGTLAHRRAIGTSGRSYLHRKSFRVSPVLP